MKCQKCLKIIKFGVFVAIPTTPSGMTEKEPYLQEVKYCLDCFKNAK